MKKLMESFDMGTIGRRRSRRSILLNRTTTNHSKEEQLPPPNDPIRSEIRSSKAPNQEIAAEHNSATTNNNNSSSKRSSHLRRISKIFERKKKTPAPVDPPKIEVKREMKEERRTSLRRIKSWRGGGNRLSTESGSIKKYQKHGNEEKKENTAHGSRESYRSIYLTNPRKRSSTYINPRCDNVRPTLPLADFSQPLEREEPEVRLCPVVKRVRHRIIQELIDSELTYLENLHDIVEGFLMKCRQRRQMFEARQIQHLFGNVEEIYFFQKQFLSELHASISEETSENLGQVFLRNEKNFSTIYSIYCNNHPQSSETHRALSGERKYAQFFEVCRLHQHMIDIPLDGFLLTPVQKICKYPLQLAELLKHTPEEHRDHGSLQLAFLAMKKVTRRINEEKRRIENLSLLQRWQRHIVDWKGEDICIESNFHIFSGEVLVCAGRGRKSKSRIAYLFDGQLIICKKEVLSRDVIRFVSRHNTSVIRSVLIQNVPVDLRMKERGHKVQSQWWRIATDVFMLCESANDQMNWEHYLNVEKQLSEGHEMKEKLLSELDNPIHLGLGEQVDASLHKRRQDLRSISTSTSILTTSASYNESITKKFASLRRSHKTKSYVF